MDSELLKELSIPLFTGAIGYLTNWSGVWMLFYPVRFASWRLPGLGRIALLLARRIQQIPGVMQGGIGWQGIIPSSEFEALGSAKFSAADVGEPDPGEDRNGAG
jgi:hypothetical protein